MDDQPYPTAATVWREFVAVMRNVETHSNQSNDSIEKYWRAEAPEAWPKRKGGSVPEAQKWPKHKKLKALPTPPGVSTGKIPIAVSGSKYSMRGGFSIKHLGPGLQPELASALVGAANHSLASSTWRSYSSVWRMVGKIARETGLTFRFPLTMAMVRNLVGLLIKRGMKSSTVLSYMASLKQAHRLRGLDTSSMEDVVVKAAVRGMKNRESLTPLRRPVMTLEKLGIARINLMKLKIPTRRKRTIWLVLVWLFFGSLRGSELLVPSKKHYDPCKTLLAGDMKTKVVKTGKEVVNTIQLTLKAPKTSRSLPVQVVEMPEIGGWFCPWSAYWKWLKDRKTKPVGGKPLFSWEDGSVVTLEEINKVLVVILPGEDPAMTTRAFRPALPSILAREGVQESTLKDLGRWTSKTYLHYVREGRSSDWRGLLLKLRGLRL